MLGRWLATPEKAVDVVELAPFVCAGVKAQLFAAVVPGVETVWVANVLDGCVALCESADGERYLSR